MDFGLDGFQVAAAVLGISESVLQFALLALGAALLLGAAFWPRRRRAPLSRAAAPAAQPDAPV